MTVDPLRWLAIGSDERSHPLGYYEHRASLYKFLLIVGIFLISLALTYGVGLSR
jgi:hypothetical protein